MSLKEKLQIVLNQEGAFVCPAGVATTPKAPATLKPAAKASWTKEERFDLVIADLHKRGNARPGTEEKLLNTIKSCLAHIGESENEAVVLLGELRTRNYVTVEGKKIKYELPQKAV